MPVLHQYYLRADGKCPRNAETLLLTTRETQADDSNIFYLTPRAASFKAAPLSVPAQDLLK